tara:strand:+ start:559 stop:879 length:321 start_codon:yes stop_codon:yes gene_type:complete
MSGKTMSITANSRLKIPGAVLGKPKDVVVEKDASIAVPEDYARHLISDRFAVDAKAKGAGSKAKAAKEKPFADMTDAELATAAAERNIPGAADASREDLLTALAQS